MSTILPDTIQDPFPMDEQGRLVAPDAVMQEGQRIRDALAKGTYGTGANVNPPPDAGQVTVAGGEGLLGTLTPTNWEQANWNVSPGDEHRNLALENLRSLAAERKFQLEEKARRAPMEDQLLTARIQHERAGTDALGMTERLKYAHDAETMQHVTGFADYLTRAPAVGSPDYPNYLLNGVGQFPLVATTAWGKDLLVNRGKGHDTLAQLAAQAPPEGYDVNSMEIGSGNQSHIILKPKSEALSRDAKAYGLTLDQIRDPVRVVVGNLDPANPESLTLTRTNKGSHVAISTGTGKRVIMTTKEYERFGGKYSPETLQERQQQSQARPTQAPTSRMQRARAALNDPEATDEERTAARTILTGG